MNKRILTVVFVIGLASACAVQAQKPGKSPARAPGGGHGLVWVNTESHLYYTEGMSCYGTTKKGKYMTKEKAIKKRNKPGHKADCIKVNPIAGPSPEKSTPKPTPGGY